MADLTGERNTVRREANTVLFVAGGRMYAGGLAAVKETDGKIYPAGSASGCCVRGIAVNSVESGGYVNVEIGTFLFDNAESAGAVKPGDVGKVCYVADDHTVTITSGAVPAGRVFEVCDDGVWVTVE